MYVQGVDYEVPPKHKKRKGKKTSRKSNHKHNYKGVLIKSNTDFGPRFYYGEECNICGKINNERYFETEKDDKTGHYIALTQDEILEKYKHLKVVEKDE